MTKTTEAETKIFKEIQAAVKKYEHDDSREGGTYFDGACVTVFQKIAHKLADVIEKQGVKATHASLVAVAREIAADGDVGFSHGNTLGFAFKKALKGGVEGGIVQDKKSNPFSRLKL